MLAREIPTVLPMFSESSYLMKIVTILYDHAGSRKLKMVAIEGEIPIHPLVDQIVMKFQKLCNCF